MILKIKKSEIVCLLIMNIWERKKLSVSHNSWAQGVDGKNRNKNSKPQTCSMQDWHKSSISLKKCSICKRTIKWMPVICFQTSDYCNYPNHLLSRNSCVCHSIYPCPQTARVSLKISRGLFVEWSYIFHPHQNFFESKRRH